MKKLKTLPLSLRRKKRYISFMVIPEEGETFTYTDLESGIWNTMLDFLGENGLSKTSFWLMKDCWNEKKDSPLNRIGIDVQEGDILQAINGQPLSIYLVPNQALVNQAGREVWLTLYREKAASLKKFVSVKTLSWETSARYREWVETNLFHIYHSVLK